MKIVSFKLFAILVFYLFSFYSYAQCPRNIDNCKGLCGRFYDNNGDGYCDLTKITEKIEKNKKDSIKVKIPVKKVEKTIPHKNKYIDVCKIDSLKKKIADQLFSNQADVLKLGCEAQKPKSKYHLIEYTLATIVLYSITYLLSIFGKIKKANHRRIWNFALLLTFVFSCLFGFFLVIQINYNVLPKAFMTLLYWHVEIGISMTVILIFHIFWHLKYYINSFK